ncbi:hypothetical protein V2J09_000625 [Rumex salicifolius]
MPSSPPAPANLSIPLLLFFFRLLLLSSPATSSELTALLHLKSSFQSSNPQLFSTWVSTATSSCNFTGVTCDDSASVTAIDLSRRSLSGRTSLPLAALCTNLPSLQKLAFGFNSISGDLDTSDLRNCTNLRYLDFGNNQFSGFFPDLSPVTHLEHLYLNLSGFTGKFPWNSLSGMTSLIVLSVGDNTFETTPFPDFILNLTNLNWLYMSNCTLSGSIPPGIGKLSKLENLELSNNLLTGEIPPEISLLKHLWQIELYGNLLTGTIPTGFGNLINLRYFDASDNSLHGDLSEIRKLTQLVSLQLFNNEFSGELPVELGEFRNLVNVSLYSNNLTGELPQKLGSWAEFNFIDISTNGFTGPIPPDMCKKGTMKKLLILQNNFSGEIPATYANCTTLLRFRVSQNSLTGTIPPGIWGLPNLNIIDIADNFLEGPITSEIRNAKSLRNLRASSNSLSGELPVEISGAASLVAVDLSDNQINGQIPESIGQIGSLNNLYLQSNQFTGKIPDSLGSCGHLGDLNLAQNSLWGQIPASLGSLQTLSALNLSSNHLSGGIPSTLSSLRLSLLDLSYNHLSGPIPESLTVGAYNSSFVGNQGLCSPNGQLLKQCDSAAGGPGEVIICLVVGGILVIGLTGCYAYVRIRSDVHKTTSTGGPGSGSTTWDIKSYHVLSFTEEEILESIKQQQQLVGKGGCGSVYKVSLKDGQELAVKHIMTAAGSSSGGQKKTRRQGGRRCDEEFDAEVGLLSSIRHVNVVKLFCSITSDDSDSSLLVYEYLRNGSLWDRLHSSDKKLSGLDWPTRYDIALGAARGLEYLHHGCGCPVIHRDIKSSNILLDDILKPKIADFGLAKIIINNVQPPAANAADHQVPGVESTHVIAGTHGYIAPEYGYTYKVNEKSDVYSFGVVLMELVTGKKAIDEAEFGENKDMVSWVSNNLNSKESVMSMVDARIAHPFSYRQDAIKVLKIAILCTTRLPDLRPSMRSVVQMLEDAHPCNCNCNQSTKGSQK